MSNRLHVKLASALLALGDIPHEHAKQMTAEQIISLYQFDHYPLRRCDGGPFEPWNLRPLLIKAHRRKSAKEDQPAIAKDKRIASKHQQHLAAMAAKGQVATAGTK